MNKKLSLFLIIITCYKIQADLEKATHQQPEFKNPVHLFFQRNLIEQLEIEEKLKQEVSDESTISKIMLILSTLITSKKIAECLKGPQVPEIAHHPLRKKSYSLELATPSHIVLTFSGKKTLKDTVESLKKDRVAHNFIIDIDGSIYPVTAEDQTVEEALKCRPFALGISGKVIDGEHEERDMNAVSLSISVVGIDCQSATEEQELALSTTIKWLKEKYNIRSYNVVDYGTIALPYGRRNAQHNLPWQKLAAQGLTIWPTNSSSSSKDNIIKNPEYISAALRKLGYITPITTDEKNLSFKQALIAFQKHYKCQETDGTITDELVSIIQNLLEQVEAENPALKNIWPSA